MDKMIRTYLIFLIIFCYNYAVYCQNNDTLSDDNNEKSKICVQKDVRDLLRNKNKPPKPPKKNSLLVLPNIGSNPSTGFLIGVGGSVAGYFGSSKKTKISLAGFSVLVTSKNQFISFLKTNIYTKENLFFLQGDLRYYHYQAPTFGLGTNSPDSKEYMGGWLWQGADTKDTEGSYPMIYDYFKFHQTVNRNIVGDLYAGIGYMLDYYWNIEDAILNLDTIPLQLTPHFGYSAINGFDAKKYVLSGFSINFIFDSRDNQVNPYKGYFANINYRINQTWLGSDQNSSTLWAEFRTYIGLSKKTPRHLIAFWVFGDFQITGKRPYLTLMALGEDQRSRSGRGYIGGRFRGEDYIYGEVEYRFPISQCSKIIGGVIFINANTASNRESNVHLFESIRPAVGFGFRFMVNKYARLNINLDFGFGFESQGFYFSGTETF